MIKQVKNALYQCSLWLKDIYTYPQKSLTIEASLDYDEYWRKKRGDNIGLLSSWQKKRADIIVKNIDSEKEITIADIGCGEGSIIAYLRKFLNISYAVGYDSSLIALEKAKELGVDKIIPMDINDTEQPNKLVEVDYTLLLEILEHVSESEKLLARAYETSRKGVFFSFPNTGFFTYRLRLLFGKFPKQWIIFPNEHLRFWTAADLKYWLQALGYKRYKIYYYKGVPVLNKLLPSLFAAAFVIEVKGGR